MTQQTPRNYNPRNTLPASSRFPKKWKIPLTRTALIIIVGTALIFIYHASGIGQKNQAQIVAQPIAKELQQIGGEKICSDGDSGDSSDSVQPRYSVTYLITKQSDLASSVEKVSAMHGYPLSTDYELINEFKDDPNSYQDYGETYNSTTTYLASKGETVSVDFYHVRFYLQRAAWQNCSNLTTIRSNEINSDKVVVVLFVILNNK
jgi:hypothetical protein